jgi:uncharacterized protein (TIGR02246 family)
MKAPVVLFAMSAAVCATWFGTGHHASALQPPNPVDQQKDDRASDRASVLASIKSLTAAFSKGDANALVAHWTAEGEYVGGDGATFRGRDSLTKAYGEFLSKNRDHHVEFTADEVRFPSRDTAVAEGHMKRMKAGQTNVSQCSLLLAREDGKWLVVILRETLGDGHTVRDLEFLIGTWSAKKDGSEVSTTYEWTGNKKFVRCHFSVTHDGKSAKGMQMIGKNPSTGALHVWTFEDEGGIGEATMRQDGKKWVQEATGVLTDGQTLTATNILTPVDADTFTWQSVERALNDEPLPDLPPVKVTRVKANP